MYVQVYTCTLCFCLRSNITIKDPHIRTNNTESQKASIISSLQLYCESIGMQVDLDRLTHGFAENNPPVIGLG